MTPISKKRCVLGFLFDSAGKRVLMITKDHPEEMKGKLNGLGGEIHKGETAEQAMLREFAEESDITNPEWILFCSYNQAQFDIACFCAFSDERMKEVARSAYQSRVFTKEPISIQEVSNLGRLKLVHAVSWLVPMALSFLSNKNLMTYEVEEYEA